MVRSHEEEWNAIKKDGIFYNIKNRSLVNIASDKSKNNMEEDDGLKKNRYLCG